MDDPIGSKLLVQIVLIAVNAFFASTETAVVSLNENKVRKQAESGDKTAALMLAMVEGPTRFLSTIQVCITLSGFLASAFAADSFASVMADALYGAGVTFLAFKTLNNLCVVFVTLILSFFMIVLGELAPKRIALQNPEGVARAVVRVIETVANFFKPVVWLLTVSTNAVLRLFRIDPEDMGDEVTEEEIRMMVDIGSESGAIEQGERTMIENIFEFTDLTAQDVMVHRMDVVSIQADMTFEEILRIVKDSGLSRFPVYGTDIDNIVGVLNTRDFLLNTQSQQPKTLRGMLRPPHLVPETVSAALLFSDMQKQKIHLAIVVDEYGGMSGIVSMEDLLEEIVGNIYDEFDPNEDAEIEKLEDNLWRVSGAVELEVLAKTLEVNLPLDEEFDTLGGMVFSTFSRIPLDGSTPEVTMHGLFIKVEEVLDHRIEKALVSKVLEPTDDKQEKNNVKDEEDA